MRPEVADRHFFPPEVATHLVKLACELPDAVRRSLSLWTCAELARTLVRDGVVASTPNPDNSSMSRPAATATATVTVTVTVTVTLDGSRSRSPLDEEGHG